MEWGLWFVLLLSLSLGALWLARKSRVATGLPTGRLVYADTTGWRPVERPLFSPDLRLTGRPDYLVRHRRDLIPVEVKSGRAPAGGPYPAHVLQLAAYCLLVEEVYDQCPPYGLIVYADDEDAAYEVDYTPALEDELLDLLDEMRLALDEGDAPRDHEQVARCLACGYRYACDEALG